MTNPTCCGEQHQIEMLLARVKVLENENEELTDHIDDLEKQAESSTVKELVDALEWMSKNRAATILIADELHVKSFFIRCDKALMRYEESAR